MQTHTQAEQKILEAKKEALLKESSKSGLIGSSLHNKLRELDSLKPNPYGTLHAVGSIEISMFFCRHGKTGGFGNGSKGVCAGMGNFYDRLNSGRGDPPAFFGTFFFFEISYNYCPEKDYRTLR